MNEDERHDWSEVHISWGGNFPSLDIVAKTRKSIKDELSGLPAPEALIFHTVLLDETSLSDNGPCVIMFGVEGPDGGTFAAEYQEVSTPFELDPDTTKIVLDKIEKFKDEEEEEDK